MEKEKTLLQAQDHFTSVDPIMTKLISLYGDVSLRQRNASFEALMRIIVSQQISEKAATTIFNRVSALYTSLPIIPEYILKTSYENLRGCGLSNSKTKYVFNIAEVFTKDPNFLSDLKESESEIAYNSLLNIKGIGDWTANIFLMFYLGDQNIFPYGDTSLIKAVNLLYGENINRRKSEKNKIVEKWSPYKTIASIYLWEWVDGGMPDVFG